LPGAPAEPVLLEVSVAVVDAPPMSVGLEEPEKLDEAAPPEFPPLGDAESEDPRSGPRGRGPASRLRAGDGAVIERPKGRRARLRVT
jgi:hypothetical protein